MKKHNRTKGGRASGPNLQNENTINTRLEYRQSSANTDRPEGKSSAGSTGKIRVKVSCVQGSVFSSLTVKCCIRRLRCLQPKIIIKPECLRTINVNRACSFIKACSLHYIFHYLKAGSDLNGKRRHCLELHPCDEY